MRIVRNLLIIGGCLLVWLILLTPIFVGIYAVVNSGNSSNPSAPTATTQLSSSWTDRDGYTCDTSDEDLNGLCPVNPNYGG